MAPVSTLSVVRSSPAAFRPISTDRPTRKACANFAMPMRMVGASASSLSIRRSSQREAHSAMTTKTLTVTSSFITDQTEMRVLPAFMPMLSSAAITASPQPSTCSDTKTQMMAEIGTPQPFRRVRAPSESRTT